MRIISKKYDTIWRRIGASFIDGIVLTPLSFLSVFIGTSDNPVALVIGSIILVHCGPWIYNILMHGWRGQTVGKMVAKIKVLDLSENKISMTQAFLRECVYVGINLIEVTLLIKLRFGTSTDPAALGRVAAYLAVTSLIWTVLEIVTTLFSERRRALHDFIAGTVVVRTDYITESYDLTRYLAMARSEPIQNKPEPETARAKSYTELR
jgi:uncharacterized RDD family membrane protein YckC